MSKQINIPGRLHSCTTDHVVAGANEIYDDVLQKKQDVINSELQLAINTNNSKVEACEDKVKDYEDKVNQNVLDIDAFNRNLNQIKANIQTNTNNIETIQTAQTTQSNEINELKTNDTIQDDEIEFVKKRIDLLNSRVDYVEGITAIDPINEFDGTFVHSWFYIDNSGRPNTSTYKQWISQLYFNNKGVETPCSQYGNIPVDEYINSKLKVYARKPNSYGVLEFKQVSSRDYNYYADGTPTNLEVNKLSLYLKCDVDVYFKYNPDRKLLGQSTFTDCIEVALKLPDGELEKDWFKWSKGRSIAVYEASLNSNNQLVCISNEIPMTGKSFSYIHNRYIPNDTIFDYDSYRFTILMFFLNSYTFNSQQKGGNGSYIGGFFGSSKSLYPRRTGNKNAIGLHNTNANNYQYTPLGGNSVSDADMRNKYSNEIEQGYGPHVVSTKFMGLENLWGNIWEFVDNACVMITRRTISNTKVRMLFVSDYISDLTINSGYITVIKLDGSIKQPKAINVLDEIDTELCYGITDVFNTINTLIEIKDYTIPTEGIYYSRMATKLQLTNLSLLPIETKYAENEIYNTNYFDMCAVYITEQSLIDENSLQQQKLIKGGVGNDDSNGMFSVATIGVDKEINTVGARLIMKSYNFEPVIDFS